MFVEHRNCFARYVGKNALYYECIFYSLKLLAKLLGAIIPKMLWHDIREQQDTAHFNFKQAVLPISLHFKFYKEALWHFENRKAFWNCQDIEM